MQPQHSKSLLIYVVYQGAAGARFDRDYYVERHLPLVMTAWQKYGLESVSAFFPSSAEGQTLALCECRFRDEEAVKNSFQSIELPEVMEDVQNFTDIAPTRLRAIPML